MGFLKTLLMVLAVIFLAVFWLANPARVDLNFGVIIVEARIGTFVVCTLLLGFVPLWLFHRATAWRLRRRLKALEEERYAPRVAPDAPAASAASAPSSAPAEPATPAAPAAVESEAPA